ncbi:MRS6 [[Candida] subhashii]|uniref:Rab proteins geranylgeranyltransferase n=1 Tax=[Candida] subhashii TaxID=561895 RepID=A0A8J5UTZ2_9ASCO|nr:MRS6 [[Candida] subhashii]KAG7665687.1 MRS6 [[Candida] subhashii]
MSYIRQQQERRKSMAERRPSTNYSPSHIPHLVGLETPQEQHSLSIKECDVLILGTGLSESILSAALSWQGTQVLHIDNKNYYGDSTSTLTIDQLKKWCIDVNHNKIPHFKDAQIYIPPGRFNSKDYGIDLTPRIMFCKSDLLSLLVKSRVYRYLEFQSLSNFHVFENDDFQQKITNTTTKEDIFMDKSLSLITKRNLMKFLKFVLLDENKALIKQYATTPIETFLATEFKLEEPQMNELVYSIGLCVKENTSTKEAIIRIKRFLGSFDVYGKFPVMVSKYGGPGELSQGFCRSAAVAGTTYKLNTNLTDYDPTLKIAHFDDGSKVKINEKLIISPTQLSKFLTASYSKVVENLETYNITRLITVVKRDCKEWMSQHESSAIVVFPPHSLPTDNDYAVQVIIQNGDTGVCPPGHSIWYTHSVEPDLARAKRDLETAYEKMESALLRESNQHEEEMMLMTGGSTGINSTASSFKLGTSLTNNFIPREKVEIVCKMGFVQQSYIRPDLSNVFKPTEENNIVLKQSTECEDIIFTNMPSGEISYDGIITDVKSIYSRIVGTDEDFFDVDFEDEEEEQESSAASSSQRTNVSAGGVHGGIVGGGNVRNYEEVIESDDEDDHVDSDDHKPFAADEMEL